MPLVTVPQLTDGVVTLRAHSEDDVQGCWEQCQDPLSQAWTTVPVPYSVDDAKRFVRDIMPGGWASDQEWGFAIEAPDADGARRYAGTVSLRNEGQGRAEIAYGSHPWVRGTGHVERALRLLLDWGFAPEAEGGRGVETVIWWANVGNWASRKVAWRLGFSCEGPVAGWLPQRGVMHDAWVGSLRRDDERQPRHAWLDAPVIRGGTVVLRAQREDDGPRILEGRQDDDCRYWLSGSDVPEDLSATIGYVRDRQDQMARGTAVYWALADPVSDVLLGAVSIREIGSVGGPEIGYWTHPDARGRGLMTEAVRLAVRHAAIDVEDGGLGLDKIRLVAAVDNVASRRIAAAAGFREVGVERLGTVCADGRHDAALYDWVNGADPIR